MVQREPLTLYGLTKEMFESFVVVDNTSPSGLRWITSVSSTATKGSVCGSYSRTVKHPCWRMKLNKTPMVVARVLWFLLKGFPPQGVVDHKNGNTYDHSEDNLRDIAQRNNCENRVVKNVNGTPSISIIYDKYDNRSWRCQGTNSDGSRWCKSYAVRKYGYDRAYELAVEYRLRKESQNDTQTRRATLNGS